MSSTYIKKISAVTHLNRRRSKGKDLIASTLCVAIHVDKDVNTIGMDTVSRLAIARDLQSTRLPLIIY